MYCRSNLESTGQQKNKTYQKGNPDCEFETVSLQFLDEKLPVVKISRVVFQPRHFVRIKGLLLLSEIGCQKMIQYTNIGHARFIAPLVWRCAVDYRFLSIRSHPSRIMPYLNILAALQVNLVKEFRPFILEMNAPQMN